MCENISVRKIYKTCAGLTNHRQTKKKVSAMLVHVKTYKLNKMCTDFKKYFRKSRQNKWNEKVTISVNLGILEA